MALVKLEIVRRESFENGLSFGDTGTYERIEGIAHYEIDPEDAANASLVDVKNLHRDEDGMVRFDGDVSMLVPADPSRGNRALLVEVPNRGKRTAQRQFNYAPIQFNATDYIDPGDGFLMRHGWSVAWCGWQWDVPKGGAGLSVRAPLVDTNLAPNSANREQMQLRIQPNKLTSHFSLTDHHTGPLGGHESIPTANVDDQSAVLMVREHMYAPATEIERNKWRFAREVDGAPVTDDCNIWLEGGFQAGLTYDIVYSPSECRWTQAGLVAMRDLGAFLKDDPASPLAEHVDHSIAEGISQCGRFLRTFLHFGMNADEAGKQVYDGMLVHIAGGRRGEFNHRYGQPSVQPTPSFGHLFPFADDPQKDPHTAESGGLLDACRASNTVPKIFYTDTAAEYWRGDAGLAHANLAEDSDAKLPSEVRRYLYSGAQHSPGLMPLTDVNASGTRNQNLNNFVDYRPLYRASLENLRAWVAEGKEPPASAYPQTSDGTAATREQAAKDLAAIPGIGLPRMDALPSLHPLDLGADSASGVGQFPAKWAAETYQCRVSAVDNDGNEVAGVRMPDVSVPVASHTGFAPRADESGGTGQLIEYVGSSIPFARDEEARASSGDPRPSIAERYTDRDDYLDKIRVAAEKLVTDGQLLREDIDNCVRIAGERFDAVMTGG